MPTSVSRNGAHDVRRAGLTLIEILVVLAIAAVLFGAGIGVFKGITQSGSRQAARSEVLNLLHKARNAARGEERSAVVIEEGGTQVRAVIQRVVALLHFEDLEDGETSGADRKDGKVSADGFLHERGKVRRAMRLIQGTIDLGRYPDYDATDGVGAELWFRPESKATMTLLEKGRSWRLHVEPVRSGLVVKAEIHIGRGGASSTRIILDGSNTTLMVGRWAHVSFSYDRAFATLEVNRVEVARFPKEAEPDPDVGGAIEIVAVEPESRPIIKDKQAPLMIGSNGAPIDGFVDEVRVTAVLSGDVVRLPDGVTIKCARDSIHFQDGWLDDRFHNAPVKFSVIWNGRGRPVTIGLNGLPMK